MEFFNFLKRTLVKKDTRGKINTSGMESDLIKEFSDELLKSMTKEELQQQYDKMMRVVANSEDTENVIVALNVARHCKSLLDALSTEKES